MSWWERNSNTVLTAVELIGFVGAMVTTAIAAPKVKKKIEEIDIPEEATIKQKAVIYVRTVGRECITPIVFTAVTLGAMAGCKRQYAAANQAAIASSYTMAKRLYDENKERVNEIMDDICPLDSENPSAFNGIEESMNGNPEDRNDIFFLEYSGRRFKSSLADVEEALALLDEQFQKESIVSFNALYLYLGIAESKLGVDNGFIDWFRLNVPDHQESEHIEYTIRKVTRATGINAEEAKKLEDAGEYIYMISFSNALEPNVTLYHEIKALEDDYSHSL